MILVISHVLPDQLVAGCTFTRTVGYHFSCCFVERFPRAFIIFKAFNQSWKIVVVGLHIVLRSLVFWLVQSSSKGVGNVREVVGEIRND